jgi:hypothetical protein
LRGHHSFGVGVSAPDVHGLRPKNCRKTRECVRGVVVVEEDSTRGSLGCPARREMHGIGPNVRRLRGRMGPYRTGSCLPRARPVVVRSRVRRELVESV